MPPFPFTPNCEQLFHPARCRAWPSALPCPGANEVHGFGEWFRWKRLFLETDQTRLLIDAGLSGRQIRLRLGHGRSPETLDGILLTHEHTDHTQGLKALCKKLEVPVYCNRLTADELRFRWKLRSTYGNSSPANHSRLATCILRIFPCRTMHRIRSGFYRTLTAASAS